MTKLGGWPTTIQASRPPEGVALQLFEGVFGDSGALYLYRDGDRWRAEWDGY